MMPPTEMFSETLTLSVPFPMLSIWNAMVSAVLGDAGATAAAAAITSMPATKPTVTSTVSATGE